jgi:hypothetical protein
LWIAEPERMRRPGHVHATYRREMATWTYSEIMEEKASLEDLDIDLLQY